MMGTEQGKEAQTPGRAEGRAGGRGGNVVGYSAASVILREGEVRDEMYKIIHGNAELYTGYGTEKEVLLGILGPHSCFGELGLLLHRPSIYTVIAYSDVYVLRVTEKTLSGFIRDNHWSVIDIMRNMARMISIMQQQIDLLSDELEHGVKADQEFLKEARRNLRNYAIYRPCMPPQEMRDQKQFIDIRQ